MRGDATCQLIVHWHVSISSAVVAWRDSDEARAVISHRVGVLKENKDGGRVITVPQLNEH